MFRGLTIFLFCPAFATASCGTHRLQYYDLLIHQSRYSQALHLVLSDLNASAAEEHAFKIAAVSDDDPNEPLSISPAVLQSGKAATCQQAAGALAHMRARKKDRAELIAYHQEWEASRKGWASCNTEGKKLNQPEEAAAVAYQCLEDPQLETHQAAIEIRALLARAAAGDSPRLSDEDSDVLQQQLNLFHDGWNVFEDKSTDSYYLPEIKRADQATFCKAVSYARRTLHLRDEEISHWQQSCNATSTPKAQR